MSAIACACFDVDLASFPIVFKFLFASLTMESIKQNIPNPKAIKQATRVKQHTNVIYSMVAAIKYPIGLCQSNGNLGKTS